MKTNRVQLIGYVGQGLCLTQLKNGTKRVAIRVSTHYKRKNRQDEKAWQTVWHDVVAWNTIAEYADRSFVKGSRIMVDGSITYRTYPIRKAISTTSRR